MSQRLTTTSPAESFVPFQPPSPAAAPAPPAGTGAAAPVGGPAQSKAMPRSELKPDFTPLDLRSTHSHPHSATTSQPIVTLQRDGERISNIRIECPCGQIIELACSYENNPLAP